MKSVKYNLDFYTALKLMIEKNHCVKGEGFVDGVYLKIDDMGQLVMVDAARFYTETPFTTLTHLPNQKYRSLTVMTLKELSK